MAITRDQMKRVGGRFFDVALGVFLIGALVVIWHSSRTKADTTNGEKVAKTNKVKSKRSRPNIEALTAIQGTECVITCPPDQTVFSPTGSCVAVNFPAPTLGAFCTGPAVCTPASGFCFPVGTTTVTCTAPGLVVGVCTFNITINQFNVCLQDDSNPNIVFLGNSFTGAYVFCCGATTFTGTAQVSRRGQVVAFTHYAPDHRVQAIDDESVFKGTAAVQSPPGSIRCTIGDRDTRNNTCVCAAPPD